MTHAIDANYFDGKTSVSQPIKVEFIEPLNELNLQSEDGNSFIWNLYDLQFERYGNLIEIRNKNYPSALLKIDDPDFSEEFYDAMKQNKRIDFHTRLLNLGLSNIIAIAALLLVLAALFYFFLLPPIAEKSAALVPLSVDDKIGNVFMEAYLNENKIDSTKSKYLKQFASNLNLKNFKPLQFIVVDSEEENAFAVPNGQIVVFSGIINNMKSSDELAALLGHEASHINNRHSIKILCKNLAGYMAVSLIFSDVNGVVSVLADNAQQLHSLSYSRKFEEEADKQGLEILIDNNIDPKGMVRLFSQFEKDTLISIPKILSSHPLTKDRKDNMQKIISETAYEVKPNAKLETIFEFIKD